MPPTGGLTIQQSPNLGVKSPIKVVYWNIAGWGGKSNDKVFLEILKDADIALLQETWMLEQINLKGFNSYCLPAFKVKNRGRP